MSILNPPLMRNYWQKLNQHKVVYGVVAMMSGHIAGQGVAFLLMPILTRLYSPDYFGVFAVYSSMIGLIGVTVSLRYGSAIPIPKQDSVGEQLVSLAFVVTCLISLFLLIIWSLFGHNLLTKFDMLRYEFLAPYILISLFVYGCYDIIGFWALRLKLYSSVAMMRSTFIISSVLFQLILAWCFVRKEGLILGQLLGYAAVCIVARWVLRKNLPLVELSNLSKLYRTAIQFRRFPLYSCGAELLVNAAQTIPPLLLVYYYGDVIAGFFLLAWRVVGTPLTLLVVPTARVFLVETSRLAAEKNADLMPFFKRTVRKLLVFAAFPVAILALSAPWLFPIVFGDRWGNAGVYCSLLCPTLLCHLISISVRPLFDVLGCQSWNLFGSSILAIFMIGGICIGYKLQASATFAVAAMSAGGVFAHIFIVCIVWWVTRNHISQWKRA